MLVPELRFAIRNLIRTPGFTCTALLTFGLGIGAATALFSVIDHALLRPLPVPGGERLLYLQESKQGQNANSNPRRLRDWQGARSLRSAAAFYGEAAVLTGFGPPRRLNVLRTFGPFLDTLALQPQAGRGPTPLEIEQAAPVAVISHALAIRHFASPSAALNRTLTLSQAVFTITGVLPAPVDFPSGVDVWTPAPAAYQNTPRAAGFTDTIARLKEDATREAADAELATIAAALASQYADTDAGRSVRAIALSVKLSEESRLPLLVLFGAVLAVLLTGVVNLSSLLLARGWERRREATIRLALGSGTTRLMGLFAAEALVLSLAGCVLGWWIASYGLDLLKALLPPEVPRLAAATLDARVALFSAALTCVCAGFAGLLPAWRIAREARVPDARSTAASALAWFIPPQTALSMLLLVLAALLVQALLAQARAPLGFTPESVVTFRVNLPWDTSPQEITRISRGIVTRLEALPNLQAVGVIDRLPLAGGAQTGPILVRGVTLAPDLAAFEAGWRTASAPALLALRIPVIQGELFTDGKSDVVVNSAFAKRYFGGLDPVGREIARTPASGKAPEWRRVVGVIGGVKRDAIEPEPMPEVYAAWGTEYWPMMSFVARMRAPAGGLPPVHELVRQVDGNQVVENLQTLEAHVSGVRGTPRLLAGLVGAFAMAALLLAALGLYGLLSSELVRRNREYGIRLALGAEPGALVRTAVKAGLRLTTLGLAVGLAGSWYLGRVLAPVLPGAAQADFGARAAAAMLLLAVAALACWIPARRIWRVDPQAILRDE